MVFEPNSDEYQCKGGRNIVDYAVVIVVVVVALEHVLSPLQHFDRQRFIVGPHLQEICDVHTRRVHTL